MTLSLMTLEALAERIIRLSGQRDQHLQQAAGLASELNGLRRELRSRTDQLIQRSYTKGDETAVDVESFEEGA